MRGAGGDRPCDACDGVTRLAPSAVPHRASGTVSPRRRRSPCRRTPTQSPTRQRPRLCRDWAQPCRICDRDWAHPSNGHRDWAQPCRICDWDWAHPSNGRMHASVPITAPPQARRGVLWWGMGGCGAGPGSRRRGGRSGPTLAPRSCPSWPILATRMRGRRPSRCSKASVRRCTATIDSSVSPYSPRYAPIASEGIASHRCLRGATRAAQHLMLRRSATNKQCCNAKSQSRRRLSPQNATARIAFALRQYRAMAFNAPVVRSRQRTIRLCPEGQRRSGRCGSRKGGATGHRRRASPFRAQRRAPATIPSAAWCRPHTCRAMQLRRAPPAQLPCAPMGVRTHPFERV